MRVRPFLCEGELVGLRPIGLPDVTPAYISWFENESSEFIEFGAEEVTHERLSGYISSKVEDPQVLMLAVIEVAGGRHIGNLKLEPYSPDAEETDLGIFIGEPSFQGRGYGLDAIRSMIRYLNAMSSIKAITLGVDAENKRALAAYRKLGFLQISGPEEVVGGHGRAYLEIKLKLPIDRDGLGRGKNL